MRTIHGGEPEAFEHVMSAIQTARESEKWMVCVYCVSDGVLKMDRTTQQFPKNDLNTAVELLKKDVFQEQQQLILPDTPLPRAIVNPPLKQE